MIIKMNKSPIEDKRQSVYAVVRNLVSAKGETKFWVLQRITGLGLIPLGLWVVTSLINLTTSDYAQVKQWFNSPLVSSGILVFIGMTLYHEYLGLKVIYEDYIPHLSIKRVVLLITQISLLTAGSLTLWATLSLSLSSQ